MSTQKVISEKKRTLIFVNILICCIATSLLFTALTTALPVVSKSLKISVTTGQWLTSGYSLAMGIIMPLTAFLIKRFQTKKLYITGIIIFIVGLIVSALSTSFPVMMVGRIFQACGNGILLSMAQVVLLTIYPDEKKGSIMGWYGLAVGATPVIAPTLSGILVDLIGWRSIFALDLVIMIVALIFAFNVFGDVLKTEESKFDFTSFILSIFAFGGVTLGIGNISSLGITNPYTMIPLVIGIIGSIVFTFCELQLDTPFLDIRIFRTKEFTLSVIGSILLYFIMMGSSVLMPLYVQSLKGYSATISGFVTLPGSLVMAVISPIVGKIYDKLGIRKLFIYGSLLLMLCNFGMYFITLNTSIVVAAVLNALRCAAIGCLMMPLVTWGTMNVRKEKVSDATAILSSLRTIGGAIGAAVFVGLMLSVAENSFDKYGEAAGIHGFNITFLCMAFCSVILLAIGVFCVRKKNKSTLQDKADI